MDKPIVADSLQQAGSVAGCSPHFGRWEIREDEHGAIVVTLEERILRFSPEAFFVTVLRQSYLELKRPQNDQLSTPGLMDVRKREDSYGTSEV